MKTKILLVIGSLILITGCNFKPNGGSSSEPGSTSSSASYGVTFVSTINNGLVSGCMGPYTVAETSGGGQTSNHPNDMMYLNASSYQVNFFTDNACSHYTTGIPIPSGTANVSFYLQDTVLENFTLKVSNEGDNEADEPITLAALSSTGDFLTNLANGGGSIGACSGPFTLGMTNSSTGATTSPVNLPVTLTSSDDSLDFYTDATCSTYLENPIFAQNSTTMNVYYKGTTLGGVTVTATSGLGNTTSSVSLGAGAAYRLIVSGGSGTQGDCVGVTVSFQDRYENDTTLGENLSAAISLSGSGDSYGAYSDSGCHNGIGTFNMNAGSSSYTFWVTDSGHESLYIELTPSDPNLEYGSGYAVFGCDFWAGC
jgi:hypothetical protein